MHPLLCWPITLACSSVSLLFIRVRPRWFACMDLLAKVLCRDKWSVGEIGIVHTHRIDRWDQILFARENAVHLGKLNSSRKVSPWEAWTNQCLHLSHLLSGGTISPSRWALVNSCSVWLVTAGKPNPPGADGTSGGKPEGRMQE